METPNLSTEQQCGFTEEELQKMQEEQRQKCAVSDEELHRFKKESVEKENYQVNHSAEEICDTALKVFLYFAVAICSILCILGIIRAFQWESAQPLFICLCSIVAFLVMLIMWAIGKVFINISHNLYSINEFLHSEKKK